jgi:lipoprotein NlpD
MMAWRIGMHLRSIFFASIVLLCGCSSGDRELPEVIQKTRPNPIHTVSDEDTVGSIAEKYGMTRADLIKLNNLEQPYQLYAGQKLIVNLKPEGREPVTDVNVEGESAVANANVQPENVVLPEDGLKPEPQEPDVKKEETVEDIQAIGEGEQSESDYIWPISNGKQKITQHFGEKEVDGIVIDASAGTPVKAIADGVVMIAGIPSGEAAAYGITVVVKHSSKKTMSIYSYLKEASVAVHQKIKQGTIIGKVGKSGTIAKTPQLYFEINDLSGQGRKSVDPEKLLPK